MYKSKVLVNFTNGMARVGIVHLQSICAHYCKRSLEAAAIAMVEEDAIPGRLGSAAQPQIQSVLIFFGLGFCSRKNVFWTTVHWAFIASVSRAASASVVPTSQSFAWMFFAV